MHGMLRVMDIHGVLALFFYGDFGMILTLVKVFVYG